MPVTDIPLSAKDRGRLGARRRWGEQRILRLDELTPEQRRLVLALLDATRANEKASPVTVTSGEAESGGTRDAAPTR